MSFYYRLPFDPTVDLVEQVAILEENDKAIITAHVYLWWSTWVARGVFFGGIACFLWGIYLLLKGLDILQNGGTPYVVGPIIFLLVLGIAGIKNSHSLGQSRLTFNLEEGYLTVEQTQFIFQQRQTYAYQDIEVLLASETQLDINTKNKHHSRAWGTFLRPEQLAYLAQTLQPIWKQEGKTTGEQEDWSRHLLD